MVLNCLQVCRCGLGSHADKRQATDPRQSCHLDALQITRPLATLFNCVCVLFALDGSGHRYQRPILPSWVSSRGRKPHKIRKTKEGFVVVFPCWEKGALDIVNRSTNPWFKRFQTIEIPKRVPKWAKQKKKKNAGTLGRFCPGLVEGNQGRFSTY